MRPIFILLLFSALPLSSAQAQLQWSKQNFGGITSRVDRADFNGDGFPDQFDYSDEDAIFVELNSGKGTTAGGSQLLLPIYSAAYLDFNRDNKLDVAACDSSDNLVILQGDGAGNLTPALTIPEVCGSVVAADFNGDGNPDVAVIGPGLTAADTNQITVFLGDGHGGIASQVVNKNIQFTDNHGDPCFIGGTNQAADFTGDRIPDLFITGTCETSPSQFTGIVIVGKGDGTGHFTFHKEIEGFPNLHPVRLVDENQDGVRDLMGWSSNTLTIFNGRGDGTFTQKNIVQTNYSPSTNLGELVESGTVADFDGDGIKDAIVSILDREPPNFSHFLRFYKGQRDGSYKPTQTFPIEVSAEDMVWGDFDKDGRIDLLMSRPGSPFGLWLNRTPSAPSCKPTTLRAMSACTSASGPGVFHFVSSPLDGLTINAIQIYVDGVLKVNAPEDFLNVTLPISDGAHRVTVKAWDDKGAFSVSSNVHSCNNTADRTVRVCTPEDGATTASSLHIVASAATNLKFSAVQVYVGGMLKYSFTSPAIDFEATGLKPGDNRITVKAWDSGGQFSNTFIATVH